MILNNGQVEIVRKHYLLNILTIAQRGKVPVKGYHVVPIPPAKLSGTCPVKNKK